MSGAWQKLKNLVTGEEEEAPTSRLEQFDEMVTGNRRVRFIGLGISALCTLLFNVLAIAFIPTIVVKPAPFAVCFTLGNIAAIVMTFFVVGPAKQIKALKEPARLIATIIFVAALIFSLVSALLIQMWFVTLLSVVIQLGALIWYILSFIPGAHAFIASRVTDQLPL